MNYGAMNKKDVHQLSSMTDLFKDAFNGDKKTRMMMLGLEISRMVMTTSTLTMLLRMIMMVVIMVVIVMMLGVIIKKTKH